MRIRGRTVIDRNRYTEGDTAVIDQLNNIEQTSEKLGGLGRTRVFHLLQTGELQSVKIGRRRFIPDSSIQQYIEGLKAAG